MVAEDDEAIRAAIHGAITGKKSKAKARKNISSLLASQQKADEGMKVTIKAKMKLSRLLGQRPDAAALKKAGVLVDSKSGEDAKGGKGKGRPALVRTESEASLAMPITEAFMLFFVEQLLQLDAVNSHGIFRLSGGHEKSHAFLRTLAKMNYASEADDYSVNDVASAFKSYLRNAPEPLIPFDSAKPLLASVSLPEEQRTKELVLILDGMPSVHRDSLFLLLRLCKAIAANADTNMMNSHNLGIVFGPTIIRERESSPTYLSSDDASAVEDLIDRLDELLLAYPDSPELPTAGLELQWIDDVQLPACLVERGDAEQSFVALASVSVISPNHPFVATWFSSSDVSHVSLMLIGGASPDQAEFCGYVAEHLENKGTFTLPSGVAELPTVAIHSGCYLVIEQVSADGQPVAAAAAFDISPPLLLDSVTGIGSLPQPQHDERIDEPLTSSLTSSSSSSSSSKNVIEVLQTLTGAPSVLSLQQKQQAARNLLTFKDQDLLPLLSTSPDLILATLRSLATSILDF